MVVVSRKFTYLPSLIKSTHSPVKGLLVYLDTHDPQGDFFQLTSYNSNLNYFQNILQNINEIFPSFSRDFATTHKMERYSFDLILLFQKGLTNHTGYSHIHDLLVHSLLSTLFGRQLKTDDLFMIFLLLIH